MNISVTPTEDSVITSSHTSEGTFLEKSDGDFLFIYRHDTGLAGDHTGNTGSLYQRTFNVESRTWGSRTLFRDDTYDTRSANGGTLASGRMVLFWLNWEIGGGGGNDSVKMIYSDDDGGTWSSPTTITSSRGVPTPYGNIVDIYDNPDQTKRYLKPFLTANFVCALFSEDGSSWGNEVSIYPYNVTYYPNETDVVYLGGGKLIALSRDQNYAASGSNYYQFTSSDYGATWSAISRTNIVSPHFAPSPRILLHGTNVIVIASDRRTLSSTGNLKGEGTWIYTAEAKTAFASPTSYQPKTFIPRPLMSSDRAFYGYPSYAKLSDNEYLVVFTDKDTDTDTTEDADLYQFYMTVENDTPLVGTTYGFPVFNNNNTFFDLSRIEDFNDNLMNTAMWTVTGGADVAETNQRLEMTEPASTTTTKQLLSNVAYNLTGRVISWELVSAGNQALSTAYVYFILQNAADTDQLRITVIQNIIRCHKKVATTSTQVGTDLAYNSAVHKYFRIRELGGTVYWDYSTNEKTWTNITSTATPIDITALYMRPVVICTSPEASAHVGIFDNIRF